MARKYSSTVKCADSIELPSDASLTKLLQPIKISSTSISLSYSKDVVLVSMDTASQSCRKLNR